LENDPVLIVTGLSGSGKTTALHALEDAGYYCIDNLPPALLPKFLTLFERNEKVSKVAVGLDIRGIAFGQVDPTDAIMALRSTGRAIHILFLESSDPVLVRRFSETRRPHPLANNDTGLVEGIIQEREELRPLRGIATSIINTSELNVHELRRQVTDHFGAPNGQPLTLCVTSFGFKYGLPLQADYVFDARFLPNPHFDRELRPQTGRDAPVAAFLESHAETSTFLEQIQSLLEFSVPKHDKEGKSSLTIAIGCTGGKHRSVYSVIRLATHLESLGYSVRVVHRDIEHI